MKRMDLSALNRSAAGKGAARSARREGRIPAVLYGGDQAPVSITVDTILMEKALKAGGDTDNILVNLSIENEAEPTLTLVRSTQHNPLSGRLEHVDFYRVSTDKPITTTVPLHTTGTPVGVRNGGMFEQVLREIEISCLPLNIPDAIDVDVSDMDLGHSMHVSDIPESDQFTILTASDRSIATVAALKAEVSAAAAAASEGVAVEATGA